MAKLNKAFTTEGQDSLGSFEAIPPGKYLAQIVRTEMKATNAGDGHYWALRWEILDGEHKGRLLFDNLNLDNPSETAMNFANKTLTSICLATGCNNIEDTDELLNIPCEIGVKVTKATAQYAAGNEINGYKAYEGQMSLPAAEDDAKPSNKLKSKPWEK